MELGLRDKVAIVTGAGSKGYGKGIATVLAKEGCHVAVIYHKSAEGAQKVVEDIRGLGRQAIAIKTDVRSDGEVRSMVDTVFKQFGKIDILVNNAGGNSGKPRPFIESTEADWIEEINLNLKGTLSCTKAVLDHMIPRKSGKIINISSMAARTGGLNVAVYESTKAGVIAFTKGLAQEVATYGIYVNCVAPGVGETDLTSRGGSEMLKMFYNLVPLKRGTTPEDVGYAVAYFASEVACDVTGQTLAVDGGITMI